MREMDAYCSPTGVSLIDEPECLLLKMFSLIAVVGNSAGNRWGMRVSCKLEASAFQHLHPLVAPTLELCGYRAISSRLSRSSIPVRQPATHPRSALRARMALGFQMHGPKGWLRTAASA